MTQRPLKILVVEDNPADVDLIRFQLEGAEPGFEIRHVELISSAQSELRRDPADLILLDLGLPDSTGFGGLDRLHAEFPSIPLVVLTSGSADLRGYQAIKRGAQDFMLKGFLGGRTLATELRSAVERAATVLRLKELRRRLEAERYRMAR